MVAREIRFDVAPAHPRFTLLSGLGHADLSREVFSVFSGQESRALPLPRYARQSHSASAAGTCPSEQNMWNP